MRAFKISDVFIQLVLAVFIFASFFFGGETIRAFQFYVILFSWQFFSEVLHSISGLPASYSRCLLNRIQLFFFIGAIIAILLSGFVHVIALAYLYIFLFVSPIFTMLYFVQCMDETFWNEPKHNTELNHEK